MFTEIEYFYSQYGAVFQIEHVIENLIPRYTEAVSCMGE